jgi:hypothetical protein
LEQSGGIPERGVIETESGRIGRSRRKEMGRWRQWFRLCKGTEPRDNA